MTKEKAADKNIPYPYNFLLDAKMIGEEDIRGFSENPDFDLSFAYLFGKAVPNPSHKEVIDLYYRQGCSVTKIHNKTFLSRQGVYDIIELALKRAKHIDEYDVLLRWGIEEYINALTEKAVKGKLQEAYQRGFNIGKEEGYKTGRWMSDKEKSTETFTDKILTDEAPIEMLEFSVRTKNVLLRSGIVNIKDLKTCKPQTLANVKGCGKTAFREVMTIREKLGCDNKEYEQIMSLF